MMPLSIRVGLSTSVSHSRDWLQTRLELCPFGVCRSCQVDNQYYIMLPIIKINIASSKGRKEVRTTGNSSAKHESVWSLIFMWALLENWHRDYSWIALCSYKQKYIRIICKKLDRSAVSHDIIRPLCLANASVSDFTVIRNIWEVH